MGIEYSVSFDAEEVKCVARDESNRVDFYSNGNDWNGVSIVEATARVEDLKSVEAVRGLLVQFETVVVPNPFYDKNRHGTSWKDMVKQKEVRRKESAALPDDMVAFMRHSLAIQESRDVSNRAYFDGLFK